MKKSTIIRKIESFNSQLSSLLNVAQELQKELETIYSVSKLRRTPVPLAPKFLDQQYKYPRLFIQLLKRGPLSEDTILRIYNMSKEKPGLIRRRKFLDIPISSGNSWDILLILAYCSILDKRVVDDPSRGWIEGTVIAKAYFNAEDKVDNVNAIITSKLRKILRQSFKKYKVEIDPCSLILQKTGSETVYKEGGVFWRIYKISVPPENINIDRTVTSFHLSTKARNSKSRTEEETKELDGHRKNVFSRFWEEYKKHKP